MVAIRNECLAKGCHGLPTVMRDWCMLVRTEPSTQLQDAVRSGLAHLYDFAYLQTNPLVEWLGLAEEGADAASGGQMLRRALLEAVEALRPPVGEEPACAQMARVYPILIYRYVDGLSMREIARRRGLSLRQAYREHKAGVRAVASIIWQMVNARIDQKALDTGWPGEAHSREIEAEAARLSEAACPEVFDIRGILDDLLVLLAPLLQRKGARITVAKGESRLRIVADRTMVRQALCDLLTHGLTVMGLHEIAITAEYKTPGLLSIDLRGDRDARAPAPVKPHGRDGENAELIAARFLVEAQGGQLIAHLESAGWHSRVTLPALESKTILAIDDNEELVELMRRCLGSYEVAVVAATHAEQALQLAQELRPQLITLDVMMPSLDGWEILQRLQGNRLTADMPVVVVSVLDQEQLALALGARGYLRKPFGQMDLLAVVRRFVEPLWSTA